MRDDAGSADARADGDDTDSGFNECVPSTSEFCDEICPETCNGEDDDCDNLVDERPDQLCDLTNAGSVCVNAVCRITECREGAADCDDVASNGCEAQFNTPEHCGMCNNACDFPNATARCEDSLCVFDQCLPGFGNCDGDEENGCEQRLDSLDNCGACEATCPTTVTNGQPGCLDGQCAVSECDDGFEDCDRDIDNGCEVSLGELATCGGCDTMCAFEHATPLCADQSCTPGMCNDGYGDCDGDTSNECEANLNTNPDHCGSCGRACDEGGGAGSMFQCVDGECVVTTCPSGFADCDRDGNNGCETSLRTLTDCGACGMDCGFTNATASCTTGTCTFGTCNAGFGNCDNDSSDGCETALDSDQHCGACNAACGVSDSRTCSGGICSLVSCPNGSADCDNDGLDCEQSLSTVSHCGACNARCGDAQGRLPNATAACGSGTCAIGMCDATFASCDSSAINGCETSLRTTANCGACGSVCSRANASVTCASGSCAIGTCNSGFANCDNNATNGCERSITTTTDCGACGNDCARPNATMACTSGMCTRVACNPGFGDCDGNASNGCEQALNTLTHCGACNSTCALANGAESCSSGTCTLGTCDTGFGNCDFMAGTGCETPLTSNSNCNACGALCDYANAAESCATRTCTLGTCSAGFGNCDGSAGNGCEQSLNSNAHCGACNNACGAGQRCDSGSCVNGFPYTTSNFNASDAMIVPAARASLSCNAVFNSTPGAANNGFTTWCGQPMPTPIVRTQTNGPDVVILAFESLSVSASLQLIGTRPVILAVYGDAMISGTIDASANGTTAGAGGGAMCGSSTGGNGPISTSEGRGGGGGGHAGLGGRGGPYSSSSNDGGSAGAVRADANAQPLLGGCGGGNGGGCTNGVAGGGAIQVSASGTLTFSGTVRANGATGGNACGGQTAGSGGGSGGSVLLEGNVVMANGGTIQVRGGNGGNGNGGNGASGATTSGSPNGGNAANDNDGAGGGGGAYGRAYLRGVSSCTNNVTNTVKAGVCM